MFSGDGAKRNVMMKIKVEGRKRIEFHELREFVNKSRKKREEH